MYINRELPPIPVGDWAGRHEQRQPGLARCAWEGTLTPQQDQRARAGYMGCVTHIDYQLGYLIERLRSMDVYNNTCILFTSDHGDMMGDHNLHRKCYAYEGSARIPLVIKYPFSMDLPTGTFNQVVGLQDVMPTLLEVAGAEIPSSVTGSSMLGAARGGEWREFFHGEHSPCYSLEQANHYLTDAKEKYIWLPCTGEEQFFDLVKDRQELHNLAGDPASAKRVTLWRNRLIALLKPRGDGFCDGDRLRVRKEPYGPLAVDSHGNEINNG